jgi:branched-chain amino acid transport system substrate-binding protein
MTTRRWFPPTLWGRAEERGTPERASSGFPPSPGSSAGQALTPPRKGERKSARILLFAVAVATACPQAHAEIRVGLAAPLTGRMAGVGLAMQRALEAVIAETNAQGGVLGEQLALIVADDGCAQATAEGAARTLIAETPAVVIGHPCSSAATAAARHYGQADVLLIAVGPRHPDVTRANATLPVPVLRLAGRDDRQGEVAAAWLLAHAPGRRVAIIHDRTAYARGIADGTVAALKAAADVAPVALLPLVANRHDYGETVRELRDKGAEAVLFAGYPAEGSLVVYGIEKLQLPVRVLGSDALATPDFARFAAQAATPVQVLLPAGLVPGAADEDASTAEARGAFETWLEAARKAGSVEARTLSEALCASSVTTRALGEIRFDANGDLATRAFAAASARDGRWVIEER